MPNLHDVAELERALESDSLDVDVRARLQTRLDALRRREAKQKAESDKFDGMTEGERRKWLAESMPRDPFAI